MFTIKQITASSETAVSVESYLIERDDTQITVTSYSGAEQTGEVVRQWTGLEGSGRTTDTALYILNEAGALISIAYVASAE